MKIFNMFKNQYSQSFQKQVVIFCSVIILSGKKNTEYSCTWIYFNIFLSIIYLIWCRVRETLLLYNVARSRKLQGTQHSPELALRSTDFCSPENLIFPVLMCLCVHAKLRILNKLHYIILLMYHTTDYLYNKRQHKFAENTYELPWHDCFLRTKFFTVIIFVNSDG